MSATEEILGLFKIGLSLSQLALGRLEATLCIGLGLGSIALVELLVIIEFSQDLPGFYLLTWPGVNFRDGAWCQGANRQSRRTRLIGGKPQKTTGRTVTILRLKSRADSKQKSQAKDGTYHGN